MKLCIAIASLLVLSGATLFAEPLITWCSLRQSTDQTSVFGELKVERIDDCQITERSAAWVIFYRGADMDAAIFMGHISPQTTEMARFCEVNWAQMQSWTEADFFVAPIDDENTDYARLDWAREFKPPNRHPAFAPKTEERIRGNDSFREQCEAKDASLATDTRGYC